MPTARNLRFRDHNGNPFPNVDVEWDGVPTAPVVRKVTAKGYPFDMRNVLEGPNLDRLTEALRQRLSQQAP